VRCCNVRQCGMVVFIRVGVAVGKIMGKDSYGTSIYMEGCMGGLWNIYEVWVLAVGGFQFLLSLLVLWDTRARYDIQTVPTLDLDWFLDTNPVHWCSDFITTLLLLIIPMPDPSHYRYRLYSTYSDWWMIIHWLVYFLWYGNAASMDFADEQPIEWTEWWWRALTERNMTFGCIIIYNWQTL
jgi:hypothetical protein